MERCLHQLGTDTSGLKTALGKMVGTAQQLSGLFASDEVLKSGIADYAFEHYEIASYKILIAAAAEAGEDQVGASSKRTCAKRKKWLRGWHGICRRSRASTCTEKPPGRPRSLSVRTELRKGGERAAAEHSVEAHLATTEASTSFMPPRKHGRSRRCLSMQVVV